MTTESRRGTMFTTFLGNDKQAVTGAPLGVRYRVLFRFFHKGIVMNHVHEMISEDGPYGCTGGTVYFIEKCECGCRRRVCSCKQCEDQGTDEGEWYMPVCDACNRRHPIDQSCPSTRFN